MILVAVLEINQPIASFRFGAINKRVLEVRSLPSGNMVGIGLTPEGLSDNYITQDLLLEMSWRQEPVQDIMGWVANYTLRRYGIMNPLAVRGYQVIISRRQLGAAA